MRRRRAETMAALHEVQGALLWAGAFSAGAAVCLLPLPLLVAHLLEGAGGSLEESAATLLFIAATLGTAVAFFSARNRTLSRIALWLDHALGQTALMRGLDAAYAPADLEADRRAVGASTHGVAAVATLFDSLALVFVAIVALLMAPLAGLVVLTSIGASLWFAWTSLQRAVIEARHAHSARTTADDLWRTAAASSVVIAARGLTPSTIGTWKKSHAQALAQAFRQSEAEQRRLTILRTILIVAACALGGLLVWQINDAAASGSASAVLVVAYAFVVLRLEALFRAMPALVDAFCGIEQLCQEKRSLLDPPVRPTADVAARAAHPAHPAPTYAEAR